jgi:hypothetical protein
MTSKIVFHPTCKVEGTAQATTSLVIRAGIYTPQTTDYWKLHLVVSTGINFDLYIKRSDKTAVIKNLVGGATESVLNTGLTVNTTLVNNSTTYNITTLTIANAATAQITLTPTGGAPTSYKIIDLLTRADSTIELVNYDGTAATDTAKLTEYAIKTGLSFTTPIYSLRTEILTNVNDIDTNLGINGYDDTTAGHGYWNNLATTIPLINFITTTDNLNITNLNIIPCAFTANPTAPNDVLAPVTALGKTVAEDGLSCVFNTGAGTPNLFNARLRRSGNATITGYFLYEVRIQIEQYTDATNFEAEFGNTKAYVVKLTNTIDYYFGTMVFNLHNTTNNTILEDDFNLIQRPVFTVEGTNTIVTTKFMFDSNTITDFETHKNNITAIVTVTPFEGGVALTNPATDASFTYNYTNDKASPYYTYSFKINNVVDWATKYKMSIVITYDTGKTYTVTLDKFTTGNYRFHCGIYNEPFIPYNKYIYHPIDNSSTTANPTILANIVLPNTDDKGKIYVHYNYNKFLLTVNNLNNTINLPIATVTYNAANKSITLYNKVLATDSAFADFGKLYISYETDDNQFFTHSFIVLPVKLDFEYNIKDTGTDNLKMNITTFLTEYLNKNETGMSATTGDVTTYYYNDIPYISSKLSQIQYTSNTVKVYSEIKVPTDVYAASKTDVKVTPTTTGFNYWFLNNKQINYDITANSNFITNYYSTYTHNAAAVNGEIDTKLFIVNQYAFENNINYYSHLYLLKLFNNMPAPVLAADNTTPFDITLQGIGTYTEAQSIDQNAENTFKNHLYKTYIKLSETSSRVPFITAILGLILTAYQGTGDNVYQKTTDEEAYTYPGKSATDIINTIMYLWDIGVNKDVGLCKLEAEVASLFGKTQYDIYITRITTAIDALNTNPGLEPYKFVDDEGYQSNLDLTKYFNLFFTPEQIVNLKEQVYQHLYAYLNFVEVGGKNVVKYTAFKTKTYELFKQLLTPDATKLALNITKYNEYLQYVTLFQTGTNAVIDVYDTFVRIGMSVASATGVTALNTSTANTLPAILSRIAAKTRGTYGLVTFPGGGQALSNIENTSFPKTNKFMYSYLKNYTQPNAWINTDTIKSDMLYGMITDYGFLAPLIGYATTPGIFDVTLIGIVITADNGIKKNTDMTNTVVGALIGPATVAISGVNYTLGLGLTQSQAWTFMQFMNYLGNMTDVLRNRLLVSTIFSNGTSTIINNLKNKNLLPSIVQPQGYNFNSGDFSLSNTPGWNIEGQLYSESFNEFKLSTSMSWSSSFTPVGAGITLGSATPIAGYAAVAFESLKSIPKTTKINATDIKTDSDKLFGLTRASKADSIEYNTSKNSKTYLAASFPGTGTGNTTKILTSPLTSLTPVEKLAHTVVEPVIKLIDVTDGKPSLKADYMRAEYSLREIVAQTKEQLIAITASPAIMNAFNGSTAALMAKIVNPMEGQLNIGFGANYKFPPDIAIAVTGHASNAGFVLNTLTTPPVNKTQIGVGSFLNFAPTVGKQLVAPTPNTNLIQVPVDADDTIVLVFIQLPSEVKINWSINKAPKISDNIKRCGDHLIVKWEQFPNAKYYCLYKYVGLCKEPIEKFTVRDTRYCDEIIKSDCSNVVRYKVQAITPQGATQLSEYATYLFKN